MWVGTVILATFITLADAESTPWKCAFERTTYIDTYSMPYSFPNVTTLSSPMPYYSPQSCKWNLDVKYGYYAYFIAYMNLNTNDSFTITNSYNSYYSYSHGYDSNGAINDVPRVGTAKFFIPGGTYTITLFASSSQTIGSLAFSVSLKKIPYKYGNQLSASVDQVVNLSNYIGKQVYFPANRTYTLRTITGGCNVPTNNYVFDACHVYRGDDAAEGSFEAGLSKYISGVPKAFENAKYSMVCFAESEIPASGQLLITGIPVLTYGATWQVTTNCPYINFTGIGKGVAFATDYCPQYCTKYVSSVQIFNSNATLDMFYGNTGSTFALLGSMNNNNVKERVPQMLSGGNFRSFCVSKGPATITLDSNPGTWNTATAPRSGFVASPLYGTSSSGQSLQTVISSKQIKYNYSFTIKDIQNGKVFVSVFQNDGTATEGWFTNTTFDSKKSFSAAGYGINITYVAGPTSKGSLTEFQISPINFAFKGNMIGVLAAVWALIV